MNAEEQKEFEMMRKTLDAETLKRMDIENNVNNNTMANDMRNNANVMEFQLDLKDELDRINHLLRGDIIVRDADGNENWVEPDDDRLKILSDYGVKQLMNLIYFYINKNTLLSNYNEEMIFWKVRDFGIELSDLIFNRYEAFFSYPTPEELYNIYKPLMIKNKIAITENELYLKCIQWSKEELQSKLRHYPTIVMALVDSIHSTYLRALNGEERESLRRQMSIIQSLNNNQPQVNTGSKFSVLKPSTWR